MNLSLPDAARLLGVDEGQVLRWSQSQGLPAYQVQEKPRFNRQEVLEWAWNRRHPVYPPVMPHHPGDGPLLVPALGRGGVHADLASGSKREALADLVDRLPLPNGQDRGHLLEMILSRESLRPTGVGSGLALPHPRRPMVSDVDEPLLAIGFLKDPLDWGEGDRREPVRTLLMLVCPTVSLHLHALARLAAVLRDDRAAEVLGRRAGAEEVLEVLAGAECGPARRGEG